MKYMTCDELLQTIGISRALLYNDSDSLPVLPTRTIDVTHYPGKGSYLVGTWTNFELHTAVKEGYKILDIEWSVLYDKAPNPFSVLIPELYKLRKESQTKFDDRFYKTVMNMSLGKFAQKRIAKEIIIDCR